MIEKATGKNAILCLLKNKFLSDSLFICLSLFVPLCLCLSLSPVCVCVSNFNEVDPFGSIMLSQEPHTTEK